MDIAGISSIKFDFLSLIKLAYNIFLLGEWENYMYNYYKFPYIGQVLKACMHEIISAACGRF